MEAGGGPTEEHGEGRWKRSFLWLLRIHEYERTEIHDLSKLVLARMNDLEGGVDGRHGAWVTGQFEHPLQSLLVGARGNATLFILSSMVIVTGGFATSGITAAAGADKGSTAAWVIFAIGLIVALAGGVSQQFRFGVRSNERRALAVTLREEGWKFVYEAGDYADETTALGNFQARVYGIQRRITDVGRAEAGSAEEGPPPPPSES